MAKVKRRSLKWTVEIEVDAVWIEDGFELTEEIVTEAIESRIGYTREGEIKTTIVKTPTEAEFREVKDGDFIE
jgi:hypothetical protein